jgi:hypothetical protein
MVAETNPRVQNLKKLIKHGIMSPKLKAATRNLIKALLKGDNKKIEKYSYIHQYIVGDMKQSQYPYRESDAYNKSACGTTAYHEFDFIWHGDY